MVLSPRGPENPKSNIQLFVTRRCQLRCRYCPVVKRDADMRPETARRAVDFLLGHRSGDLRLDFGGGEPLLNYAVVRDAVEYARAGAARGGKRVSFYMVTNALELDDEKLAWLRERDFLLELSLDGERETHNRFKRPVDRRLDPYAGTRAAIERVVRAGLPAVVIVVASPAGVGRLAANIEHVLGLGVRRVDVSYALGSVWDPAAQAEFFRQLDLVVERRGAELRGRAVALGNLDQRREPSLLNGELMVDVDGSLHLLTEWMFESTPGARPAPMPLGRLEDAPDINRIHWSAFSAYYTLVRMHEGSPRVRAALLNNIAFGLRVGRWFSETASRLHIQEAGCVA